jgi:hypothetical protein
VTVRAIFLIPAALQATAMLVDEGWFHRRRGLPRWERLGHPLDTLTTLVCYAWLLLSSPSTTTLGVYIALAGFSCLFVTKDEPVHARVCTPGEQWLHAVLFVLHPIVFAAWGWLWWTGAASPFLEGQVALTVAWMTYQIVYWSVLWKPRMA